MEGKQSVMFPQEGSVSEEKSYQPHGALQAPVAGKQGAPLRSPLSWQQVAENSQLLSMSESQR